VVSGPTPWHRLASPVASASFCVWYARLARGWGQGPPAPCLAPQTSPTTGSKAIRGPAFALLHLPVAVRKRPGRSVRPTCLMQCDDRRRTAGALHQHLHGPACRAPDLSEGDPRSLPGRAPRFTCRWLDPENHAPHALVPARTWPAASKQRISLTGRASFALLQSCDAQTSVFQPLGTGALAPPRDSAGAGPVCQLDRDGRSPRQLALPSVNEWLSLHRARRDQHRELRHQLALSSAQW